MIANDLKEAAVRDPYTTVRGAFTAAREAGLVEVREGQPVRTKSGESFLRQLKNRNT